MCRCLLDLMNQKLNRSVLEALLQKSSKTFKIEEFCFKEQISFIQDSAPFATGCCGRRSGKTISCAADLTQESESNPGRVNLYITLSRANGKKLIWPELLEINRHFNIGAVPNEADLSLTYPNGSIVYVTGAKDKTEIEKFRGLPLNKVYVDESQAFRSYIQELIDDVISKALYDYDGKLRLIGTPGPIPVGYFYDACHSSEWSHHSWNMFQNPWIEKKSGKTPQTLLEQELKRRGITIDHPSIRREVFGEWVIDSNSLVFQYNKEINDYESIPEVPHKWEYVIGVDVGFDDADAIAVIGWNEKIRESYLVEEIVKKKQGITELAQEIERLIKLYDPRKVVMDTGGLGKKIAEEIRKRYSIPIHAAEKTRKFEYIEILNDAMRTKKFFAKHKGQFAQDSMLVEWDRDSSQPKVSDTYHSDICDAVLYGFRESMHWTFEPEVIKPKFGTPEWFQKEVDEMEEAVQKQLRDEKEEDIWGDSRFDT